MPSLARYDLRRRHASLDDADRHSFSDGFAGGGAEGDCVPIPEPGEDLNLGEIDRADGDWLTANGIADDQVDIVRARLGMESFARDGQHIIKMLGGDSDGDVYVGQQIAIGIVEADECLADIAGAVIDDGGGKAIDAAAPGTTMLGVPDNSGELTSLQVADFRFVEVGLDAEASEVSYLRSCWPCCTYSDWETGR